MDILIKNFEIENNDKKYDFSSSDCLLDFDGECPTNTCDCGYFCDSDDSDDKWD